MTAGIADVLIVLGLVFMTLVVYGIVRFPTSTRSCTPRARRPF
jgi:multisubunit Na+/H+ antiporter MnhG subunit